MSTAFTYLGKITIGENAVGPIVHDVYGSGDLAESWEYTRLKYYPDYVGPPPDRLEIALEKLSGRSEKKSGDKTIDDKRRQEMSL